MKRIVTCSLALLLAACVTPVEDDPDGPIDVPGPAATMYRIRLIFDSIYVRGDCDLDAAIVANAGDFAIQVGYELGRDDGGYDEVRPVFRTNSFGRANGEIVKIKANDTYELGLAASFEIPEHSTYRVHFDMIEWDGDERDARLEGPKYSHGRAGGPIPALDISVTLGEENFCKAQLKGRFSEKEL